MTDPLTEFLEHEGVTKEAGLAQTWERLPSLARAAIGTAGVFAAGRVADEAYSAAKDAIGKSIGFRRVMKYNPALEKMDRSKVKTIFNTLHNVSPDLAGDPIVANPWINRMTYQEDYVDPRTLSDLATAQERMRKKDQGRGGFMNLMQQATLAAVADPYAFTSDAERIKQQRRMAPQLAAHTAQAAAHAAQQDEKRMQEHRKHFRDPNIDMPMKQYLSEYGPAQPAQPGGGQGKQQGGKQQGRKFKI